MENYKEEITNSNSQNFRNWVDMQIFLYRDTKTNVSENILYLMLCNCCFTRQFAVNILMH